MGRARRGHGHAAGRSRPRRFQGVPPGRKTFQKETAETAQARQTAAGARAICRADGIPRRSSGGPSSEGDMHKANDELEHDEHEFVKQLENDPELAAELRAVEKELAEAYPEKEPESEPSNKSENKDDSGQPSGDDN